MDNSPNPELVKGLLTIFEKLNAENINNAQYNNEFQKLSRQYGSDELNTLGAKHIKQGNPLKITNTVINGAISTSSTLTPNDKALTLANSLLFALSKKYLVNPQSVEGSFRRGRKAIKDTIKNWKDGDYDRLNLILYQSGLMPTFQKLVKQEAGYESVLPPTMAKNLDRWKALPENANLDFSVNPVTGSQEFTTLDLPDQNVRLEAGGGIFFNNTPPKAEFKPVPSPPFGQAAYPPSGLARATGIGDIGARIAHEMATKAKGGIDARIEEKDAQIRKEQLEILKATVKAATQGLMERRLGEVDKNHKSVKAALEAKKAVTLSFDDYYGAMHPRGFNIDEILQLEDVVKAYNDLPDDLRTDDLKAELVESAREGIEEGGPASIKTVQTIVFESALALDGMDDLRELLDSPNSILPVDSTKAEFAKWESGEIDQSLLKERELLAKVLQPNPQPDDSDPEEKKIHGYTQDQIHKLGLFKTWHYEGEKVFKHINWMTLSTLQGFTGEPVILSDDYASEQMKEVIAKLPDNSADPRFNNGNPLANALYNTNTTKAGLSERDARTLYIQAFLRHLIIPLDGTKTEKNMRAMWGEALNASPENFRNDFFQSLYDHDLLFPFMTIAEREESFVGEYAIDMAKEWVKDQGIDPIRVMLDHKITSEKSPDGDLILIDFSNGDILAIDIEKDLDPEAHMKSTPFIQTFIDDFDAMAAGSLTLAEQTKSQADLANKSASNAIKEIKGNPALKAGNRLSLKKAAVVLEQLDSIDDKALLLYELFILAPSMINVVSMMDKQNLSGAARNIFITNFLKFSKAKFSALNDDEWSATLLGLQETGLLPLFEKLVRQDKGYESFIPGSVVDQIAEWKASQISSAVMDEDELDPLVEITMEDGKIRLDFSGREPEYFDISEDKEELARKLNARIAELKEEDSSSSNEKPEGEVNPDTPVPSSNPDAPIPTRQPQGEAMPLNPDLIAKLEKHYDSFNAQNGYAVSIDKVCEEFELEPVDIMTDKLKKEDHKSPDLKARVQEKKQYLLLNPSTDPNQDALNIYWALIASKQKVSRSTSLIQGLSFQQTRRVIKATRKHWEKVFKGISRDRIHDLFLRLKLYGLMETFKDGLYARGDDSTYVPKRLERILGAWEAQEADLETDTPNPILPSDTAEDTERIKQSDPSDLAKEVEEEPSIELAPIFDGSTYDPLLVKVRQTLQATKDRYYDGLAELPADSSYPALNIVNLRAREIPVTIVPDLLPEGKPDAEVNPLQVTFQENAGKKRSKERPIDIQRERRDNLIEALTANPNINNDTLHEFTHPNFEDGEGKYYTVIHAETYDGNWTQYAVSIAEGEPVFAEKKNYIVDPVTGKSNRTITDLRESLVSIRIKFSEDQSQTYYADRFHQYEKHINDVANMKPEDVTYTTKTQIRWIGYESRSDQLFNSVSAFIKEHKRGPNKNDGVIMTGDVRPDPDTEHPSLIYRTHWKNLFRVLREEKIMGMENVKAEKELLQWAINKDESFKLYDALDEDVQAWLCSNEDEMPAMESPAAEKPSVSATVTDANAILSGQPSANDNVGTDDSDMVEVAGRKVKPAELRRMLG